MTTVLPPTTVAPQARVTRTTVIAPPSADTAAPQRRRSLATVRRSDVLALLGAGIASVCATLLLFDRLAPLSGRLGFVVIAYLLFLLFYAVLVSFDENSSAVRDRVAATVVHSLAAVLFVGLLLIVGYTLYRGAKALPRSNFYTQDMTNAGPLEPLSIGGILHAAVGTLEMISIALLITVPLGLLCAVFLTTTRGGFARFTRTIVEAMTALPSIVAGLFIYATLILILGFDKSGFAASLALSVMMLPIIIRAADVVLRLVPGTLTEASYALGANHWRTMWSVVLPTARSGLTTAVILGTARGIGETSPVLLTAGFTASLNANPFKGPQISLPLAAFEFVRSPQPTMVARGFGTAAVLMVLVLVLFVIARILGGRGPGALSRRQSAAAARASRRDADRFVQRRADLDDAADSQDDQSDVTQIFPRSGS